MNELIKILEEIQSRTSDIVEIGTSALVDQALSEAREHAARVDQLHEVITGNVEHSIAAWLDKKADLLADQYADAHVPQGHIAWETVKIIQALAHGVETGAWKA